MSTTTETPWERFATGRMGFDHRAHLQMAYEALREHDVGTALVGTEAALRRVAAEHGHPEKFHATLTALWMLVVGERLARAPELGFEAFLAANEDLLDARALPRRYYREGTLDDPVARRVFVLPDRLA